MLTLYYCQIEYENGQSEYAALPEVSQYWADEVFASRKYSGDVDIFCEHPIFNQTTGEIINYLEYKPPKISRAEHHKLGFYHYIGYLLGGSWSSVEYIVEAFSPKDAARYAAEFYYISNGERMSYDIETLSVEKQ